MSDTVENSPSLVPQDTGVPPATTVEPKLKARFSTRTLYIIIGTTAVSGIALVVLAIVLATVNNSSSTRTNPSLATGAQRRPRSNGGHRGSDGGSPASLSSPTDPLSLPNRPPSEQQRPARRLQQLLQTPGNLPATDISTLSDGSLQQIEQLVRSEPDILSQLTPEQRIQARLACIALDARALATKDARHEPLTPADFVQLKRLQLDRTQLDPLHVDPTLASLGSKYAAQMQRVKPRDSDDHDLFYDASASGDSNPESGYATPDTPAPGSDIDDPSLVLPSDTSATDNGAPRFQRPRRHRRQAPLESPTPDPLGSTTPTSPHFGSDDPSARDTPEVIPEDQAKLQRARAILQSASTPTSADVQFVINEQPNLPSLDDNDVSCFLLRYPLSDLHLREQLLEALSAGASASPAQVAHVRDNALRAVALGAATQLDIETFLGLHDIHSEVNVDEIVRILAKPYFDVTADEYQLVLKHENNSVLANRRPMITSFLRLHNPVVKQKAATLRDAVDTLRLRRYVEWEAQIELANYRWNEFGLPIHRTLSHYTEHFFTNPYSTSRFGTGTPALHKLIEDLSQASLEFFQRANDSISRCRNIYELIIVDLEMHGQQAAYPMFAAASTFEEFVLPRVLAHIDAALSTAAGPDSDSELARWLQCAAHVVLPGHPRRAELVAIDGSPMSVELVRAAYLPITSVTEYCMRAEPLVAFMTANIETPGAELSSLLASLSHLHNLRLELKTIVDALPEAAGSGAATPGTTSSPDRPVFKDPITALADVPLDASLKEVSVALYAALVPSLTTMFVARLHNLLDRSPFGEASMKETLVIVNWFRQSVFDLAGATTCGNKALDSLQPTSDAIHCYARRRARDTLLEAVHTQLGPHDGPSAYAAWSRALSTFGPLLREEDPYFLSSIADMNDFSKSVRALLKAELMDVLRKDPPAADIDVETCLRLFKHNITALGAKVSVRYAPCTTAAEARAAFAASGQIPANRAAKLINRLQAEFDAITTRGVEDAKVLTLLGLLHALLQKDPTLRPDDRQLFLDLHDSDDARKFFCAPTGGPYREYRRALANYRRAFTTYVLQSSDQSTINDLHAQLVVLDAEVTTKLAASPGSTELPRSPLPLAPKSAAVRPSRFRGWEELAASASPYRQWIGSSNGPVLEEVDDPSSADFVRSVYAEGSWRHPHSLLYTSAIAANKNVLAHLYAGLPFFPGFSPVPQSSNLERTLPSEPAETPAALVTYLLAIDVHLQALSEDPLHLAIWALRAQQALYFVRTSSPLFLALLQAYRQVQKAVVAYPANDALFELVRDALELPLTRSAYQDLHHCQAGPENCERPAVVAIFRSNKCPLPLLRSGYPGPSAGMVIRVCDRMLQALRLLRHPRHGDFGSPDAHWMSFWELQLVATFNPRFMLPHRMLQWISRNKTLLSSSASLHYAEIIRGYAIQNRSCRIYDHVMLITGEFFKTSDRKRPVNYESGWFDSRSLHPFLNASGSIEVHMQPVSLKQVSASEDVAGEEPARSQFDRALKELSGTLNTIMLHWDWFGRKSPFIKIAGSLGYDAGGPSRDLINILWMYLLNSSTGGLMTMADGLVPNLFTDPNVGKILGPLITFGFTRELKPYRWLNRDLHDLLFFSDAPSDEQVLDTYGSRFANSELKKTDSMPFLIAAIKALDAGSPPPLDTATVMYTYTLPLRDLFNGFIRTAQCGDTIGDVLEEHNIYTEEDKSAPHLPVSDDYGTQTFPMKPMDDDQASLLQYLWHEYLWCAKVEIASRWLMFSETVGEHFHRCSSLERLKTLMGENGFGSRVIPPTGSRSVLTPEILFEGLRPPVLTAAMVAERLSLDSSCTEDNNSWHIWTHNYDTGTEVTEHQRYLHPMAIPVGTEPVLDSSGSIVRPAEVVEYNITQTRPRGDAINLLFGSSGSSNLPSPGTTDYNTPVADIKHLFGCWLMHEFPDMQPDITAARAAADSTLLSLTERQEALEKLSNLLTTQETITRRLEYFLTLISGSPALPPNPSTPSIEIVCKTKDPQQDYEKAVVFFHTCFRKIDLPPSPSASYLFGLLMALVTGSDRDATSYTSA